MIGNDLIYLPGWPDPEPERKNRFLSKLFNLSEREFINNSLFPCREALLWSMKEAAYKVNYRYQRQRFYAPKKFGCKILSCNYDLVIGEVAYQHRVFLTQSTIQGDFLHTIALPLIYEGKLDEVNVLICENDTAPNERKLQDQRFSQKLAVVKDGHGIPQLHHSDHVTGIPISISHDGGKIAFAWL